MNRIALTIGLLMLAGCGSGGGGEETPQPSSRSLSQPGAVAEILTVTDQGLQRGKTNGQEQRLVFARYELDFLLLGYSQGHVFYAQDFNIWAVRTDGTGARQLANTTNIGQIAVSNGPWLMLRTPDDRYINMNFETGTQFQFDDARGTVFIVQNETRLISSSVEQISSITNMGTDRLTYDRKTAQDSERVFFFPLQFVGNTLVYWRGMQAYMVPLAGGGPMRLDEDLYDTYSAWSIGDRVIYHRRLSSGPPEADVVSIRTNGTDRMVLTTHPENEAVQGTIGNLVLIRRNLSGNDQLIAVPVTGGAERLLMTMTDDEFVQFTESDFIIVRRPSGTWTLDVNGTLKQIGTVPLDFGDTFAGNAVCGNSGSAVWCMPLDGSTPAVKIADVGRVIGSP